jgi:dephospho-CoA kinase
MLSKPVYNPWIPMNSSVHCLENISKKGPLKVAVTGSAGSGKSSVCKRLKQLGLRVISSDILAREAVRPKTAAYRQIVAHFGKTVVKSDGTLDREMLRHLIVTDDRNRKILEQFVHPQIINRICSHITAAEKEGVPIIAVEVPLLFELALEKRFDLVLLVIAERATKIERLMARDHTTRDDAEALLNIQMPDKEKVKNSDFVIDNNGSLEQTIKNADIFFDQFCKKK